MTGGEFFFKYRGFTPVPLLIILLYFAGPDIASLVAGVLVMLLGESIRLWGVSYAGGETRTREVGASALVTSGPFAFIRNPLYFGNMTMYTGAALMANIWLPWLILFVWTFFGVQYGFIVGLEEKELQERFGEEYHRYRQSVPRIIPNFKKYPDASTGIRPNLRAAFRSERSSLLGFAVIVLLMAGKMLLFR